MKYSATLIVYDNDWCSNDVLDNLNGCEYYVDFNGLLTKIKLKKENNHLMVLWESRIKIPEDTYYIYSDLLFEEDIFDRVININGILNLKITPIPLYENMIPIKEVK